MTDGAAKTFGPYSPATEMLWALRAGQITAVELLDLHIRRAQRYDGAVNSLAVRCFDYARDEARAADARLAAGEDLPLLGLPVTVKESVNVRHTPSTAGVAARKDHRAMLDAPTVHRLRVAGAVVFAKTNVCTWLNDFTGDNPIYGRTNNPWDLSRTSGGSSAGSAALAAGLSPLDLGSDLAGSIRVPAAFCGLWGHKPSDGVVPNSGHFPGFDVPNPAASLSAQGPMARSAADLELAMDVIAGPEESQSVGWRLALPPARHRRLSDFRVAVLPLQQWLPVDPDVLGALDRLANQLGKVGATVAEAHPPGLGDLREHHRLFRSMMWAIIAARWTPDHRREVGNDRMSRTDEFHKADAAGILATAGEFLAWHERRETYRAAWQWFFRDWDVVLTPASLTPAFPHPTAPPVDRVLNVAGKPVPFDNMSFYPGLASLAGQPATVLPAGLTAGGLPVGVQAIGPFHEDRTPLAFARLIEREFGGFRPPPGFDEDFV